MVHGFLVLEEKPSLNLSYFTDFAESPQHYLYGYHVSVAVQYDI